jgi:hypothetical protein
MTTIGKYERVSGQSPPEREKGLLICVNHGTELASY